LGRRSTTGGVRAAGNRIELYFRFQGKKARPTLERMPTEPNLRAARRYVDDIERRIRQGTFDIAKEFPTYKGLARFVPGATRRRR
jgi:hypothetical protein